MCTGFCIGCGYTASAPRVRAHQADCLGFAELFSKLGPGGIQDVEAEYEKWEADGKRRAKEAAHAASIAATDRRRAVMAERFATKDILED